MEAVKALVLPYKKKLTQYHFLLHRELIPAWDQDKDLCGICVEAPLEVIETEILKVLSEHYGYAGDLADLLSLGVSAGDRSSSEVFYLYAIDITKAKSVPLADGQADAHMVWTNEETLLESLDAQLCTCYARAKFLLF